MMPAGTEHTVMCTRCRAAVVTVLAYPERACGASGITPDGMRVSCTLLPGNCRGTVHHDEITGREFTAARPRLMRSTEGKTGRA